MQDSLGLRQSKTYVMTGDRDQSTKAAYFLEVGFISLMDELYATEVHAN